MSVLEEKSSFKMLGLTFSSKWGWGSNPPGKLELWFVLWNFSLLRLLCIKINLSYFHAWNSDVWAGAPSYYLELLDKLQKRIYRVAGLLLATSLELLAHRWNVASLSLFYKCYFGSCSSELAQLVLLPFYRGRSTCYSYILHDFYVTIPRCYKDAYVNSFFPRTTRLWNSLPTECFPLTYDLNCYKSRSNRHLITVGSFQSDFLYA